MASREARLCQQRRHRAAMALALRLGCSLAQARWLLIKQRLDARATARGAPALQPAEQPPALWWKND